MDNGGVTTFTPPSAAQSRGPAILVDQISEHVPSFDRHSGFQVSDVIMEHRSRSRREDSARPVARCHLVVPDGAVAAPYVAR